MAAIWLYLRRNPVLIILIIVGGLFIGQMIQSQSLKNKNDRLLAENAALKIDTLAKGKDIIVLRLDTAYYLKLLGSVKLSVDSLRNSDKKSNPGLVTKFPDIKDIKSKRP